MLHGRFVRILLAGGLNLLRFSKTKTWLHVVWFVSIVSYCCLLVPDFFPQHLNGRTFLRICCIRRKYFDSEFSECDFWYEDSSRMWKHLSPTSLKPHYIGSGALIIKERLLCVSVRLESFPANFFWVDFHGFRFISSLKDFAS